MPQHLRILRDLKRLAASCENERDLSRRETLYEELRTCVHQAELVICGSTDLERSVKETNILDPSEGLPRIFKNQNRDKLPPDLRGDSFQLYNRWIQRNFDQDILRGIIKVKQHKRNADNLDKAYRDMFPVDVRVYGDNDLVIGQWWPTQLCVFRDGAHGSAQGGKLTIC